MQEIDKTLNLVEANYGLTHRGGNNGQIQLWQFLLELLTSKEYRGVIQWLGKQLLFYRNRNSFYWNKFKIACINPRCYEFGPVYLYVYILYNRFRR